MGSHEYCFMCAQRLRVPSACRRSSSAKNEPKPRRAAADERKREERRRREPEEATTANGIATEAPRQRSAVLDHEHGERGPRESVEDDLDHCLLRGLEDDAIGDRDDACRDDRNRPRERDGISEAVRQEEARQRDAPFRRGSGRRLHDA